MAADCGGVHPLTRRVDVLDAVVPSGRRASPLEPCLQCQADSGKKNRCARDELPTPEPGLPHRLLLIVPREPVSGEAYRHAHFPYRDGPSRTGSLVKCTAARF